MPTNSERIPDVNALLEVAEHLDRRIAEQERRIQSAQDILKQLKKARSELRVPGSRKSDGSDAAGTTGQKAKASSEARGGSRTKSDAYIVREFVRDALRQAGHPMTREQIRKSLEAAGKHLNSPKPLKRIGKIMWEGVQKGEFRNTGNGYWFHGEPVPSEMDSSSDGS
jgi:hypothetical protein